jgi:Flavin containing amine oxidoreductase
MGSSDMSAITTSSRIGIIGAGAAGLSVAHALRQVGCRAITILERNSSVGGKCRTFRYEGRAYELGAAALTNAYRSVRSLLSEFDLHAEPGCSGLFLDETGIGPSFVPPPLRGSWLRIGREAFRLGAELYRHRTRLRAPGLNELPPQLHVSFAEFVRRHDVAGVAALIQPWFTGFGYGYFEDTAAAYVLKYLTLFRFPIYEILEGGYQGLWERVAEPLDVVKGIHIRAIERHDDTVVVDCDDARRTFDVIVLACPFEDALSFLDATAEERLLFTKIRTNDYDVVAAVLEGFSRARYGFFSANMGIERRGEPLFWYRRFREGNLCLFYALSDGMPIDRTIERVDACVRRLGGRLSRVHVQERWRYFPHVAPADMRACFYERLEAMQGTRRTLYAGELLSFATVESVVAYSRALVDRFFLCP